MKIGICDDNEKDLQLIYEISRDTVAELPMEYEIVKFHHGNDLLQQIQEFQLLILDIEMPDVSGIKIKDSIDITDRNCLIIFVTEYEERIKDAFGVPSFSFIEKDNMKEELPRFIVRALNILRFVYLEEAGVDSRKVMYIKAENIYCDLYLSNGRKKESRIPLKQYESLLKDFDFVRIHRSYLVNLQHVDKITDRGVHIKNNILPVSTRMRKIVVEKYNEYIFKNARF